MTLKFSVIGAYFVESDENNQKTGFNVFNFVMNFLERKKRRTFFFCGRTEV